MTGGRITTCGVAESLNARHSVQRDCPQNTWLIDSEEEPMLSSLARRVIIATLVPIAMAVSIGAQETTGRVAGAVSSQDGQRLPDVTIRLDDPDHGLRFTAISDGDGRFRFEALPLGRYRLIAGLAGFSTVTTTVRAALGQTAIVSLALPLGPVTDTIEVTGTPVHVDTASTVSGITVDSDELSSQVPLSRDVTQFALLAPGTVPGNARFDGAAAATARSPATTRRGSGCSPSAAPRSTRTPSSSTVSTSPTCAT